MISDVIRHWFQGEYESVDGCVPAGSPDRVYTRGVVQSRDNGARFVLEGVTHEKELKRTRQAETLADLCNAGCPLIPAWIPTASGQWGVDEENLFWQVRPYVVGMPLPRETYGQDDWRGQAMASFIHELQKASQAVHYHHVEFSIVDYIRGLLPRIRERNEALFTDLQPIWKELDDFSKAERELPMVLAHGDFHPLNVLWGDKSINGVIDWEFMGSKPDGYDAANLLGCLGMDTPEFLTAPMAMEFVESLSPAVVRWLPEYIVALRFAWMREWCWRRDKEMMIQELDFLWLMLDNRDFLRKRWGA
ncbi:MAG: phosphotransferase [Victivallales bacterium]|nr:phosphotransferase [Victivallales bacterium]